MRDLYPLRFEPFFRRYLWGGRRLETVLNKPLGPGEDYAESWEVVDHGKDQSVVAYGDLQGMTLGELVAQRGKDLFGQHNPPRQFPLLFKFLDAQRPLSVQVHPDDERASRLDPPDLGKTEAWVVVQADPGSLIYAGLREHVDRPWLEAAMASGMTESCLHRFSVRAGDCVFIPAGTVHALGAGLVVAEIQQASDTTFRLFDWNRVGADGKPRPLHLQAGLDAIDFSRGPVAVQRPQAAETPETERLVACDKFVLDRRQIQRSTEVGGDQRFHILSVLAGQAQLEGDPSGRSLEQGQTALIPASVGKVHLSPVDSVTALDIYIPFD
ncbi:MAG: class I mannose-6-phosphate isomerase [Candidatus Anammoximicrobium sp.]|nr:class I mannose-6-phosphate isomerase [Candidatus Anammoximicrobium sp.]